MANFFWTQQAKNIELFSIFNRTYKVDFIKKEGSFMAYARQTALVDAYICDTEDDLTLLPRSSIGSTCWVISERCEYICNSKGKWIPHRNKNIAEDIANYYTKAEVDNKISVSQIALTENEILAITLK